MARPGWLTALALAFALVAAPVFGQGSTTATLSGVVVDKDGGVIPGATIVLKNVATGETTAPIVTNSAGAYSFPGLAIGTYTVTISMAGFKTAEVEARLLGSSTNSITTKLEVGRIEEFVRVTAGSDLIRTETPTVTQTVTSDFISTLPRMDRNALHFMVFLPGVQMTGGQADDGARFNTSIVGLSNRTINVTIDGVTTSSLLDNQGMFALITPRLDAVEEVSLTTASAGADASGQGAVQIRIATRTGTNRFQTSLYWFQQHKAFNSNTYFNRLAGLPVPQATNYTYGGRVGGPIILPGFDGRGRAFFFFNHEELLNPFEERRTATMIRQSALDGNFTYGPTGATTTRNVLQIAAQTGNISTYDPTIKALLESMRAAALTTGTINELVTAPNTASYARLAPTENVNHAPTTNITVNLTPKHRLQGSYYYIRFTREPDNLNSGYSTYPGFPAFGNADQHRTLGSVSLRSTVSASVVNEARGGWQWAPIGFHTNGNPSMYENQGGFNITTGGNSPSLVSGFGLTVASPGGPQSPNKRNTANFTMADQFTWLKGSHSMTFGADYTHINDYDIDTINATNLSLGFNTNFDPADSMFNTTNFPGSTSAERNTAKALYALLTGRVASISGNGRLNEAGDAYTYNGPLRRQETQDDYSFYAQDVFRWKPTVTITAGLRYQLTMPMKSKTGNFTAMTLEHACGESGLGEGPGGRLCNMFNGGNPTGPGLSDIRNPSVVPQYYLYSPESKGYNTDVNNLAPNVGISWRPNVQSGFLRKLLGDPELATLTGGFTRSFNRQQLDQFLDVYNGNPGQSIPATRSSSATAFPLVLPGEQWPVLYREKSRLGPPAFNPNPVFPITGSFGSGAWIFNPEIEIPITDSWNVSFQRSVTKDTVFEIRYQGNLSRKTWTFEDWNDINVYETGWLTGRDGVGLPNGEFERAQANLRANVLAGMATEGFRYTGIAGTSPLPIILAHFNGSTNANNPAAYTGNLWTNTTFTGQLDPFNPSPAGFANNLYLATSSSVPSGLSTRLFDNALKVGYPSNFWVLNSKVDEVNVQTNSTNKPTNHFVILQLRRRLADGLAAQVSYTWRRSFSGSLQDFHLERFKLRGTGIPHGIQTLWTYDLPFGRGKRYGSNMNAVLDAIAGGWTFSGTARFQRQSFVLREAVLKGMTLKEAQEALSVIRVVTDPVTGVRTVFNFPEDIYVNTRLAYATDETQVTFYVPGTEPEGPLGIPTADGRYRYFAPAGGPDCSVIYPGDCGTQELWFLGRWFGEMDFRLAKSFQLPGRARFEFSAEVFNATRALNFPTEIDPGTSGNSFRIEESQSGARTAQLVWRVSW